MTPRVIPRPSTPPPYIGGTITLPAGLIANLLDLIQAQLFENCPGTCVELQLAADPANSGAVTVGAASYLNGPLSATNYAYKITPTSLPRIYRSTFPGNTVPLGDIQVLAASANVMHVEIWT